MQLLHKKVETIEIYFVYLPSDISTLGEGNTAGPSYRLTGQDRHSNQCG